MKRESGFTLIELMIVVAIIAILTGLGISIYLDSVSKSQLSEAFTITDGVKTDVVNYYNQAGQCPVLGTAQGFPVAAASYSGKYVASVDIQSSQGNCVLTATMRGAGSVTPKLTGQKITLSLDPNSGSNPVWTCASTVNPKYLPQTCR